ncbi:MAG: T9SS type A sorting domain-containing protein [Ginsengibacter sp.]
MNLKLLICLIVPFFSFTASALTYYISPLGKDANAGTSAGKPWLTIKKVNSVNFKGDTILFQGGSTFNGSLSFNAADIGTPTKPIVVSSYGTGRATIYSDALGGISVLDAAGFKIKNLNIKGLGRTYGQSSGIIFYTYKDSFSLLKLIVIDSVEVYGYHNSGISVAGWNKKTGYRDVSITNCKSHDNGTAGIGIYAESPYVHKNVYLAYNTVFNNFGNPENTTGNSGSGIVLGNVDTAVVEYCTSYENGALHKSVDGGPNGIWAYESNKVVLQFNEAHHNTTGTSKDGGGFDLDGGCINSIIQYNYSHDNYGAGLMVAQHRYASATKNNTIRYNISENDGRKNNYGAVHLWTAGSNGGIQGVEIYNNIIYLSAISGSTAKAFFKNSGYISSVNVRNNIFQVTGSFQLISMPSATGVTFQGNNYWSSGSSFKILWGATTYTSLSAWRTATGQEKISGVASGFQVDPQYTDTTRGKTFNNPTLLTSIASYKIKSTSALYNTGLNLNAKFGTNIGLRDFWGNSLVGKTTFHVGAWQTSSSTISSAIANVEFEQKASQVSAVVPKTLHAYPNPVSSFTKIEFTALTKGVALFSLYDLNGKLIKSFSKKTDGVAGNNYYQLNTFDLVTGTYLLTMKFDELPIKTLLLTK